MKKKIITIAFMLTLALSFGLVACENSDTPSAPVFFAAVLDGEKIEMSWNEPLNKGKSDIIRYEVSKDNGETWTDVGLVHSYTFTELTAGTYFIRLRAVNEQGAGKSGSVKITV